MRRLNVPATFHHLLKIVKICKMVWIVAFTGYLETKKMHLWCLKKFPFCAGYLDDFVKMLAIDPEVADVDRVCASQDVSVPRFESTVSVCPEYQFGFGTKSNADVFLLTHIQFSSVLCSLCFFILCW